MYSTRNRAALAFFVLPERYHVSNLKVINLSVTFYCLLVRYDDQSDDDYNSDNDANLAKYRDKYQNREESDDEVGSYKPLNLNS